MIVCVSMMVTAVAVVAVGSIETMEMPVLVVVTVSVESLAGAVTVLVAMTVVGASVGEVPPSMGTTEYRGRRA